MLTAFQQHRRAYHAERARRLKIARALTECVRQRERRRAPWQQWAPPDVHGSVGYQRWSVHDDFGTVCDFSIGGGPLRMVRWSDGRTLWDELRVLQFVFGEEG